MDFYVQDFPGLAQISVETARAFRSPAFMMGFEEARFFVDLEALAGVSGAAEVAIEELLDERGEGEEMFSGTVLESCRYEISVDFSRRTETETPGPGQGIGRKLFERLVAPNVPMAYAVQDAEKVAAEFSPETGVRDLVPPVPVTDESLKTESVLSVRPTQRFSGERLPTAVNSFFRVRTVGNLVIFEPLEGNGSGTTLSPIIEVRSSLEDPEFVGSVAGAVVDYLSRGELDRGVDDPLGVIATAVGKSVEEFTDQAASFLVAVGSGGVTVTPWHFRRDTESASSSGPDREVVRVELPSDSRGWGVLLREAFGTIRGRS
ncbi:hypothetical protein NI17_020540 [Thermobifida halotolerans]|uniref:Uncharacterized protein n=1 Tax=Thermobifida halotolerans TaxID=483545 RepID=A0A399G2B6_9ACTN|nr:hypothetical protein [Thermobifida halotolerans]UOE19117.1 hypothetical protein NI17_020540 [Thermobifida halotolerans]